MENTELLKKIFLFKQFTAMELLDFNRVVESHTVQPGDTIISQGEIGDALYIIKRGTVDVMLTGGESPIILTTLSAIDHFGEMALLDDNPRSATVRAATEVELLIVKRSQLETALAKKPVIAAKFYRAMSCAMAERLRKSNDAVFKARDQLGRVLPPQ